MNLQAQTCLGIDLFLRAGGGDTVQSKIWVYF